MTATLLLLGAIGADIIATTALKASEGMTKVVPVVVLVVSYVLSLYLFSLSLQRIPVSLASALLAGIGTVGIVLVGVFYWKETMSVARIAGVALILLGVIVIKFFESSPTESS